MCISLTSRGGAAGPLIRMAGRYGEAVRPALGGCHGCAARDPATIDDGLTELRLRSTGAVREGGKAVRYSVGSKVCAASIDFASPGPGRIPVGQMRCLIVRVLPIRILKGQFIHSPMISAHMTYGGRRLWTSWARASA